MMRDIKKLLRSKKGAAIEMAIFLMLIVFLFSTLITVFCLSAHTTYKRQQDRTVETALIDSFGEAFVKSTDKETFKIDNKAYTAEVSNGGNTLKITETGSGRVRLIVTVETTSEGTKVKSWQSFNQSAETTAATVETTATNTPENQD